MNMGRLLQQLYSCTVMQLSICLRVSEGGRERYRRVRERWITPQGCAHVLKCENGVMAFTVSHSSILLSHHHSLLGGKENLVS